MFSFKLFFESDDKLQERLNEAIYEAIESIIG
jgi:hypothetical protein